MIGDDNVEGILISYKKFYKYLEFLQNQGPLVGVLNDNYIQVSNLLRWRLICSSQWKLNNIVFSIISGSHFIYVRDEHNLFSAVNFNVEEGQHSKSSSHFSVKFLREVVVFLQSNNQPIIEIQLQSYSFGNKLLIVFQDGHLILWEVFEAKSVFLDGGNDLELKYNGDNNSEMETNFPTDNLK